MTIKSQNKALKQFIFSLSTVFLNFLFFLGHPLFLITNFFLHSLLTLINAISEDISQKIQRVNFGLKRIYSKIYYKLRPLKPQIKKRYLFSSRLKDIISSLKFPVFFSRHQLRRLFFKLHFLLPIINKTLQLLFLILIVFPKKIVNFSFYLFSYLFLTSKRRFLIVVLLFVIFFMSLDVYYLVSFLRSLPSPATLRTRNPILTTKIYDRNGRLLYKIFDQKQNRTLVSLDDLPPYLKEATIAIEDKDFYKHGALSLGGILRAFRQNIRGEKQGGSTITQQLVKNVFLSPDKTIERKLKEIILAIQTEMIFSKDEILTMYFNEVSYGGTAYGIEEASQTYFGKTAKNLTLTESALLAGLPAAPTYYSPFGANPNRALTRENEVLRRMQEDGYLTKEEKQQAFREPLIFTAQKTDIKAPHFIMYLKDLLVEKYGEKLIEQGGLSVFTSLDLDIQNQVQEEVTKGVDKQNYLNVKNGAAIVTNPKTGEILAMVGSKDYFDAKNDGNVNVVIMPRQPGSSIKPVNYAAALSLRKITPSSVISDSPITYRISDTETYSPQDYDGKFRGNVTMRQALANSLNVPAVKTLSSYGVDKMIDMGESLGITTWQDRNRFGLSLTLGGGEVKMIDMAKVFGTFATGGNKVELKPILKIIDHQGKIIADYTQENKSESVLSPGIAYIITNILSDNFARSMIFGAYSSLFIPNHVVAVKTGTTETKKDNWTIGYTPDFLTAVWIGNNDSSPMSPLLESGISGAAPIWHNIMVNLLKDTKDQPIPMPSDVVRVDICKENGLLPCSGCTKVPEYYLSGTEPKIACQLAKPLPKP